MIGYWLSFALIFPLVLIGISSFKAIARRMSKIEITPEMEKIADEKAAKLVLFYWLCNLFYMSCFINNLACKYIFGGLIMLIIFTNLFKSFSYPKDRNPAETWSLLQDFIIGLGLSIYLIYIIPVYDIKEIVIPVVAAVYGGFITLVGVSWTIKKAEKDRKEEEIKKARPVFSYNMLKREPEFKDDIGKICMSSILEILDFSCDVYVELENSNLSSFELKRIFHDGKWTILEGNTIVLPSSKCLLNFKFTNEPRKIFLEVEDSLLNKYFYQLFVLALEADLSRGCVFHTVKEIKNITKEEMEMIMKEAK